MRKGLLSVQAAAYEGWLGDSLTHCAVLASSTQLPLSCVLQAAGQQGDTAPPPPEQDVDLHFIAFVEHNGEAAAPQQHALSCTGCDTAQHN